MAEEFTAVTVNIKTAPHDKLDGLLGGDDNGCYHLSEEEYSLMMDVLDERREENESDNDFYKLIDDEYNRLITILDMLYPDEETDVEDKLNELIDARIAAYLSAHKIIDSGEVSSEVPDPVIDPVLGG